MNKILYPLLKPTDENKFVLLQEYKYKDITVSKGYETNGADIPRFFWIVVPPFKPKYLPAVLVHDFLIATAKNEDDIRNANKIFKEILLEIENSFVTKSMVKAVNIYWEIKLKVKK